MGNQPNNFIQCGLNNQKDTKQQRSKTRQQAINQTRGVDVLNNQFLTDKKISTRNSLSIFGNSQNGKYSTSQKQNLYENQRNTYSKVQQYFIPEHENLTKISKKPKNNYIKSFDSQYYQQQKGKGLDEIIQSRYNTTMHFPQYQIISLLQSLVYSLAYMSKKGINHHDYYPTNIFYSNGVFKLLNPLILESSAYVMTQKRIRFSFLSPELILEILHDKNQQEIRKDVIQKSDVFAIGMILLEFCTLLPSSECYDPQTYSIIDSVIQERIDKVVGIYNPLIGDCIDLMLQYEVDRRISPIQLSYIIHKKIGEIRVSQAEQERINQMSRLSMSVKLPPGPGIQRPPIPGGFGQPPQAFIAQQHQLPPQQTSPLVASNIPNYLINPNMAQNPYIQAPTIPLPFNPQLQPQPIYTTSDGRIIDPAIIAQLQSSGQIRQLGPPQTQKPTIIPLSPNSKKKLNPFQQIKQEQEQYNEQNSKLQPTPQNTEAYSISVEPPNQNINNRISTNTNSSTNTNTNMNTNINSSPITTSIPPKNSTQSYNPPYSTSTNGNLSNLNANVYLNNNIPTQSSQNDRQSSKSPNKKNLTQISQKAKELINKFNYNFQTTVPSTSYVTSTPTITSINTNTYKPSHSDKFSKYLNTNSETTSQTTYKTFEPTIKNTPQYTSTSNFSNTNTTNIYSTNYSSSIFTKKQETLDERVNRILQASKNIK